MQAHGRIEHRKCYTFTALEYLPDAEAWPEIKSIALIESQRTIKNKTTFEKRYFVSSLGGDAHKMLQAIRRHWSIENNLHWRLDVTFNEDKCRTKFKNCPQNLNIARKIALNILDADQRRLGGANKRKKMGWNDENIIQLIKKFMDSINNTS